MRLKQEQGFSYTEKWRVGDGVGKETGRCQGQGGAGYNISPQGAMMPQRGTRVEKGVFAGGWGVAAGGWGAGEGGLGRCPACVGRDFCAEFYRTFTFILHARKNSGGVFRTHSFYNYVVEAPPSPTAGWRIT